MGELREFGIQSQPTETAAIPLSEKQLPVAPREGEYEIVRGFAPQTEPGRAVLEVAPDSLPEPRLRTGHLALVRSLVGLAPIVILGDYYKSGSTGGPKPGGRGR